jgi:uncharacterized protein (TIGR03435 family)
MGQRLRLVQGLTLALLGLYSASILTAQASTSITFDVSSVKPAAPDRSIGEIARRAPPGQWRLFSVTLWNALAIAYPEFRLPGLMVGGPSWVGEERFDLQARLSLTATQPELQAMIRTLLNDRFALRTHIERRTLDVYVLTRAEPHKPPPGLTRPLSRCIVWRMTGGPLPDECDPSRRGATAPGTLTMAAATIADLIGVLTLPAMAPGSRFSATPIDRPVVDRTGLEGYFHITGPSPMAAGQSGAGANGSFFTLMEEQLGLRFTRAREEVDVLVIDSASRPEPD